MHGNLSGPDKNATQEFGLRRSINQSIEQTIDNLKWAEETLLERQTCSMNPISFFMHKDGQII